MARTLLSYPAMMRVLSRLMLGVLIVSMAGCGSGTSGSPAPTGPSPTPSPSPSAPSPSPSPSPSPAPSGCAVSLTGLPATVPARQETYPVVMSIGAGCAWTARSDAAWADFSPSSGTGGMTMTLAVAEQVRPDTRLVTLTINGQSFAVRQDAHTCTYTLSAAALEARNEGSSLSVRVAASSAECRWSVTTAASWITVQTPSVAGTDYAYFTVAPHSGPTRQAVVTIAGQPVTVTQPGS